MDKVLITIILLVAVNCNSLKYHAIENGLFAFLHEHRNPLKLNLFLECWRSENLTDLIKTLSKNNLQGGLLNRHYNKTVIIKEHEFFIIDLDCYNATEFFSGGREHLLPFPYRWFIFISDMNSFPEQLPIYMNSRIFLFSKKSPHLLRSPYRVLNSTMYYYDNIGTWVNGSYTTQLKILHDYEDRANYRQHYAITATGVMTFPRSIHHLQDWRFLTEDPITKHNFLLMHHLMDVMNSTLRLTYAPGWGTRPPNGAKYNYMIGDLQSSVADISGTVGYMTTDRISFIDYAACPIPTTSKFVLKAPPLSLVNNILTMPFELKLWLSTALLLAVIFGCMLTAVKYEWRMLAHEAASDATVLRPNSLEVFQLEIGAVCQQGNEAEPLSLSGRIITFCTFLSFLFIYTAYSACIVSLLTSTSNSIQTLDDLLTTNIKLAADNMPYTKFFFSIQTGKVKEAIFKEKIIPPNKPENFLPSSVGVERMRTEFFAFHAERDQIYKLISKTYMEEEKCGLVEIKYLSQIEPYMMVRKRAPFKEIVIMAYSKFKEYGISNRIYRLTYTDKPKCDGDGGTYRSVSLIDVYFAMLTYGIGIGFAIFICMIEMGFMFVQTNKVAVKRLLKRGYQLIRNRFDK